MKDYLLLEIICLLCVFCCAVVSDDVETKVAQGHSVRHN